MPLGPHQGGLAVLQVEASGGPVQGRAAVVVEQLGVGPGSQQGPHARLVPLGPHQGGLAVGFLQVGVGRMLQQNEHDGEVAVVRRAHERGAAQPGLQVDARASLQQHPHHL